MSGRPTPRNEQKPSARLGLSQRRHSAAARSRAVDALQRFVKVEQWNGLVAGDVVRIAGHSQRGRHWRFRAHVTNTSNGATWVEVALVEGSAPSRRPAQGSPDEDGSGARVEKIRSFDPDLVEARWSRLGRRRSTRAQGQGQGQGQAEPTGPEAPAPAPAPAIRAIQGSAVRVIKRDAEPVEQPALF